VQNKIKASFDGDLFIFFEKMLNPNLKFKGVSRAVELLIMYAFLPVRGDVFKKFNGIFCG
jgi:hypothetical protein